MSQRPHRIVSLEPRYCGCIWMNRLIDLSANSMTFDGHFYDAMHGRMFPEFIMHRHDTKQCLHIEITSYKELEDTSEYWTDEEEGGRICLFPTQVITVSWRVLAEVSKREVTALASSILRRREEFQRQQRAAEYENQPSPTENGVQ